MTTTPFGPDPIFECLPVAIRAYTTIDGGDGVRTGRRRSRAVKPLPQRTLVFDCETTADQAQRLLFGVWRLYIDRQDTHPGQMCVQEGIFHADNLADTDPDGFAKIRSYALSHRASVNDGYDPGLRLLSRAEFVEQVLFAWGYRQQATIVGFNLAFDLTRLATHAGPARGRNSGGFSLRLWDYKGGEHPFRPRVVVRTVDRYRTLISFTTPADTPESFRGRFLDLATLSFAHTDRRGLTLERACTQFGVDFTKRPVEHGNINDAYLDYCRDDVTATAALHAAALLEHRTHPIDLPAPNTFSAATIGKAYWKAMGIAPTVERHPELSPEVHGLGMAAFFGGRAECRIRKVDVPVMYVDFLSMYMTCNALMNTWTLIVANDLTVQDATRQVHEILADPDLRQTCMKPQIWSQLHTLVRVQPNGATLPVRARYQPGSKTWGIGINPYISNQPAWYPLADLIAATLLGGPTPDVLEAFTLTGDRCRDGLSTTKLGGAVSFDPKHEDFFVAAVEHRRRSRHDPDPVTAQRLDRFLKVMVNSTGYGNFAEYRRNRELRPVPVTVHADTAPFTTSTPNPETPGPYCFPLVAATVTGAARLMLTLLETHVTDAGGTYAFCDTDSMAIISTEHGGQIPCPGGTDHTRNGKPAMKALAWRQVQHIIEAFTTLNPYNTDVIPGSILEIENENYNSTGKQHQLHCFAISAKRYQLTTTSGTSAKNSEHGLGHLLNPTGHPGAAWIEDAWHYLRHPDHPEPQWLDQPAVSRVTVSRPEVLQWFTTMNSGVDFANQIKPGNFLLVAYPDPLDLPSAQPVAPYDRHPANWLTAPWIDRTTGKHVAITTNPIDGYQRPDIVRVHSYRDILTAYLAHPETKALDSQRQTVNAATCGLLQRRPIEAIHPLNIIGKEANDLDELATGLTTGNESTAQYLHPTMDDWHQLVIPVLHTIPHAAARIASETRVELRTVQRALTGNTIPRRRTQQLLTAQAVTHARTRQPKARRTDTDQTILYRHLNPSPR